MKSPPRARSPTVLRILLYSGFGTENLGKGLPSLPTKPAASIQALSAPAGGVVVKASVKTEIVRTLRH